MKRRLRIHLILILLGVCVLGTVAVLVLVPAEPSFEGRYFSDWIWTMNGSEAGPEKEKARAVVRQLGTNSVSLLLNWLREEDHPSFIGRFDAARHAVFFWLVRHKLIANQSIQSLPDFNRSHRGMAIGALPELDHTGRLKAVPTLIRMLGEKSHWPDEVPPTAYSALIVLSKMAPESTAPLIQALSSRDPQVWAMAAGGLGEIGPGASAAIPVLEQRLADKDPMIRVGAARVICKLGGDPNAYLPVVIQSLNEVDLTNLFFPLEVLLQYKQHAHAAVPALTSILNKTRASTNVTSIVARNQVIQALKEIDPEK